MNDRSLTPTEARNLRTARLNAFEATLERSTPPLHPDYSQCVSGDEVRIVKRGGNLDGYRKIAVLSQSPTENDQAQVALEAALKSVGADKVVRLDREDEPEAALSRDTEAELERRGLDATLAVPRRAGRMFPLHQHQPERK